MHVFATGFAQARPGCAAMGSRQMALQHAEEERVLRDAEERRKALQQKARRRAER